MPECLATRHVDAPAGLVFALSADFAGAPGRVKAIEKVELLTTGPVGLGTRFRETRTVFGRSATEEMEVVAWDPPKSYVLGCESHGCRYRSEIRVSPDGGGARLEMSFEAVPLTRGAKILSVLMKPMLGSLKKTCARDLDDIAAAAEAGVR